MLTVTYKPPRNCAFPTSHIPILRTNIWSGQEKWSEERERETVRISEFLELHKIQLLCFSAFVYLFIYLLFIYLVWLFGSYHFLFSELRVIVTPFCKCFLKYGGAKLILFLQ